MDSAGRASRCRQSASEVGWLRDDWPGPLPIALPSMAQAACRCRIAGAGVDRREVVWLRITFHGAARSITGTAHLLEIDSKRILLDCGLFDSDRIDPNSPNRQFPFDPRALDAVIVSHAHNDHIGRLPCLIRAGYAGPIFTTPATGDIANIMLRDSREFSVRKSATPISSTPRSRLRSRCST